MSKAISIPKHQRNFRQHFSVHSAGEQVICLTHKLNLLTKLTLCRSSKRSPGDPQSRPLTPWQPLLLVFC